MKRLLIILTLALASCLFLTLTALPASAKAVDGLLNRIGGKGTSKRIATQVDATLAPGTDVFEITADRSGKRPLIKGSSTIAVCAGIGWYLNHYAHVNLTWNHLTTDLSQVNFPVPTRTERHSCRADYRYYLNYCTFGYSMTAWTWERWQQEIDWMALRGINMPLQIVGLETVWRDFLMKDCGYTEADAEAFIPGPAFTAWWGMNNLEGWGGTTHNNWFVRQAKLAKQICDRERELGMQPVLPGFSGMVPSNFTEVTGIATDKTGLWCGFQRPYILDPSGKDFAIKAQEYYLRLKAVMGDSRYYSMDPFHEGGTIASGRYSEGYRAIFDAMNKSIGTNSKWVIQQWQWNAYQRSSLTAVPEKRLIVLDLFSDGRPAFDYYKGYEPQEAVYCAIPNFGGRTGFFGRLPKMADNYFKYSQQYATIRGIGSAPEAIEQTPVVYDLLYELPWMDSQPDTHEWIKDYVLARYGATNQPALEAWTGLLETALNNTTALQGPHEAVVCARPSLRVNSVSTWGGCDIFYKDKIHEFIAANMALLKAAPLVAKHSYSQANYSYDLCDVTRQTLSDYSYYLLQSLREANEKGDQKLFSARRDCFLQLILDMDRLLGTNRIFRLGNWTETARQAATEIKGWTPALQDWLERDNARTLITTWGHERQSEGGGLRDYSYRQWQGLLKDFYYPRWEYFFSHHLQAPQNGWFEHDWNWAHETPLTRYLPEPEGDTYQVAKECLEKYIVTSTSPAGKNQYTYRLP